MTSNLKTPKWQLENLHCSFENVELYCQTVEPCHTILFSVPIVEEEIICFVIVMTH